jgi:hypothetical protein
MADEQIVAQLIFEALDRASREMQKISRSLEVMGDESEETDRDLAQVADGLEEVGREGERAGKRGGMSMTDFKSTVDLMKQSVNELKEAVKKTYEFAELGAQAIQTEESFEFLREEMELGPGYLDRLSEAAGGTIPQLKLMAGVGTLAAGTSREFGAELADAYPTLVEYARAAAKLNPHLEHRHRYQARIAAHPGQSGLGGQGWRSEPDPRRAPGENGRSTDGRGKADGSSERHHESRGAVGRTGWGIR